METKLRISVLFFALFSVLIFASMIAEGKIVRIDTHAHYVPPFYADLLLSKGITSGGLSIPEWSEEAHLTFMDSLNIELAVLSVSTPGARLPPYDVEDGRKLARQLNEYGHEVTKTYPGRFQFFATLTLPDVEGSIDEAVYAFDTLKAAGVTLMANSQGEYLGSPKFDPLMEVLDAREATVFIHPSAFDLAPVVNDVGGEEVKLPAFIIDFLLDTTRAASNMVMMNVTRRYANIKFILAHSGGFLPFSGYRMSGAIGYVVHETPDTVLTELQKFYVDTALSSSPSALPSTLQFVPNDQITFGSDYPFAPTPAISMITRSFDAYPLEDEKRNYINFHCASSLFQKPISYWENVWHQDTDMQLR